MFLSLGILAGLFQHVEGLIRQIIIAAGRGILAEV